MKPRAALEYVGETGLVRGGRSSSEIFVSSMYGGAFLAVGGTLLITVAGGSPALAAAAPGAFKFVSSLVFPAGLAMIIMTGTDLLTSGMMYCTAPYWTHPMRNTQLRTAARVMAVSLAGNVVGSVIAAVAVGTVVIAGQPALMAWVANLAVAKTSLSFTAAFVKGVGANFMVNLAVLMATTSKTPGGKLAALWIPITAFVALGLEHSVANMFFLSLGALCGADITLTAAVLSNFVPVIAGNFVGALLVVRLYGPFRGLQAAASSRPIVRTGFDALWNGRF
jgi:formate/nitrite transporter